MKNLEEGRPRLHKEWAQREKSLRDTRIRNIHRKRELTNSLCKNWEKVTQLLHRYRSCMKEWITWMILKNFKMLNRYAVEYYLTFPVSRQSFQVLVKCWAATEVCDLIHEICLVHRETFLTVHVQLSIRHRLIIKECFTLGIKVLQAETQCEIVQGNLSPEVKKEIEKLFQRRDLHGDHQPWILSFQQKGGTHRITWLINKDFRSRSFNLTNSTHLQRVHVGK